MICGFVLGFRCGAPIPPVVLGNRLKISGFQEKSAKECGTDRNQMVCADAFAEYSRAMCRPSGASEKHLKDESDPNCNSSATAGRPGIAGKLTAPPENTSGCE